MTTDNYKVIALNRRARFDYEIMETIEAGIILTGSEVKSLRLGKASIAESHVGEKIDPESQTAFLCLFNANIEEYKQANRFNHEPRRPRKLLVKKKELNKLLGSLRRKGLAIIPLRLYFNKRGLIKIEIALAKGKKTVDKREAIKEREWNRSKERGALLDS